MILKKQTTTQLEKQLSDICTELYSREPQFQPLPPWILVRVLDKEWIKGMIILPDTAQNKPVYEAIVLSVWKPYTETRFMKGKNGEKIEYEITHSCDVKPGDRIAFPYHEGMPITYLDDKRYRLVREGTDQNKYPYCGVYGTINYDGDENVRRTLAALFSGVHSVTISGK